MKLQKNLTTDKNLIKVSFEVNPPTFQGGNRVKNGKMFINK